MKYKFLTKFLVLQKLKFLPKVIEDVNSFIVNKINKLFNVLIKNCYNE